MQKRAAGGPRRQRPSGGSIAAALFGAAATVVVLIGVVAIAASPRSLSDDARHPASAEAFEITPLPAPEFHLEAHARAPDGDRVQAPRLQDPGPTPG